MSNLRATLWQKDFKLQRLCARDMLVLWVQEGRNVRVLGGRHPFAENISPLPSSSAIRRPRYQS